MLEIIDKSLKKCNSIAECFNLELVKEINDEYSTLIYDENNTITFVDLSGLPNQLFEVVSSICEIDFLSNLKNQLRGITDWTVNFQYGEKEEIFVEKFDSDLDSNLKINITSPCDILKSKTIYLVCAGNTETASTRYIAASSKLVLLINATMALTNAQKSWMDSFVKNNYDFDRFYISLSRLEDLVEENDENEVIGYVKSYASKYDENINIIRSENVYENIITSDCTVQNLESKKCMIRNLINEINEILDQENQGLVIGADEYSQISHEIMQMSSLFINSGEITANNVLDNEINRIIDCINKSAEEYSNDMFESIKQTVEIAKEIDEVEEKINPYMEKSWEYFAKQTSKQISKDFDEINFKLTQRMQDDVEEMINKLGMNSKIAIEDFVNNSDSVSMPRVDYTHTDDAALKAVSRNARNLIILSIPMLFVSPTLSLAAILGSGIYSKLSNKKEDKNYRDKLIINVNNACKNAKENAINYFIDTLHTEQNRMKDLVLQGYQNFLNLILQNLEEKKKNVDLNMEKSSRILAAKEDLKVLLNEL